MISSMVIFGKSKKFLSHLDMQEVKLPTSELEHVKLCTNRVNTRFLKSNYAINISPHSTE